MTKTPKTDKFAAEHRGLLIGYYQALDFARELERENAYLNAQLLDLNIKLQEAAAKLNPKEEGVVIGSKAYVDWWFAEHEGSLLSKNQLY